MSSFKRGDKKRPSRIRYHSEGRRSDNKMRRIKRCNGENFLKRWLDGGYGMRT